MEWEEYKDILLQAPLAVAVLVWMYLMFKVLLRFMKDALKILKDKK